MPEDRVRVIGPDGKTGTIPRSQLLLAAKKGYRLAPPEQSTTELAGQEVATGTAQQAPTQGLVGGVPESQLSQKSLDLMTKEGAAGSTIADIAEFLISGGPAKKMAGGVGLGMAGRAVGDTIRAATTNEPVPKDLGEFAQSMGEAGLTSLGGEIIGRGGVKIIGKSADILRAWLGKKIPARQAMELIADQISSGKITAKELTDMMRTTFDAEKRQAGKMVGESLRNAADTAAKSADFRPSAEQTLKIIDEEINIIKEKLPTASKEVGDKLKDLMGVLKGQRNKLPRVVDGKLVLPNPEPFSGPKLAPTDYKPNLDISPQDAVQKINEVRRDFFHAARETNYREAKRIDRRLSTAASQDIEKSFQDVGMDIPDVKAANKRFAELSEIGESDKLKNLFGLPKFRKSPGAVMQVVRAEPELAAEAIQSISKDPKAIADVRKAIFQDLFDQKKLTVREGGVPNPILDSVFGAESKKVKNFIRILDEARTQSSKGVFNTISAITANLRGTGRLVMNDATGGPILEIPLHKVAKALGHDPKFIDVLIDGMTKPATTQKGGQLARALFTAISEVNRKENE